MSKQFVICEVMDCPSGGKINDCPDFVQVTPTDRKRFEVMRLHHSRIIDGDRLRYGCADFGDEFFDRSGPDKSNWKWFKWGLHEKSSRVLILDPPSEPKSDLNKLIDTAPPDICDNVRKWIRDEFVPGLKEIMKDK